MTKGWSKSVQQLANDEGISVNTVRAWILNRKLRRTKLGRLVRITQEDWESFVDACTAKSECRKPVESIPAGSTQVAA